MPYYNNMVLRDPLIVAVYNLKSETLKIHAGGKDKMRIQFTWPKGVPQSFVMAGLLMLRIRLIKK